MVGFGQPCSFPVRYVVKYLTGVKPQRVVPQRLKPYVCRPEGLLHPSMYAGYGLPKPSVYAGPERLPHLTQSPQLDVNTKAEPRWLCPLILGYQVG
jgi:hypothetical protein